MYGVSRRGEDGVERKGGPLWSPACLVLLLTSRGTLPHPRATIKALPTLPNRPRPYGSLDFLPLSPAEPCHPECSEGSPCPSSQTPRSPQSLPSSAAKG